MLIVCTQDQIIRTTADDPNSGSPAWAPVILLNEGSQPSATAQFEGGLRALTIGSPLALSAHGNDCEIGDADLEGWGWSVRDVARMLDRCAPDGWLGPLLIHACATTIVNFSARLAVRLGDSRFRGMWCYGYNRPLGSTAGFPPPSSLGDQADLQGTQV
jgi:hypothetical protein